MEFGYHTDRETARWRGGEIMQPQMNAQALIDTTKMLVAGNKGLLAMDESNPTCNKRFAPLGIPQTKEFRRAVANTMPQWKGREHENKYIIYHPAPLPDSARRNRVGQEIRRVCDTITSV